MLISAILIPDPRRGFTVVPLDGWDQARYRAAPLDIPDTLPIVVPCGPHGLTQLGTVEERKEYFNDLVTNEGTRLPGYPKLTVQIDTGHHRASSNTQSEVFSSKIMSCRILDTTATVQFVVKRDDLIRLAMPKLVS